MSLKVENIRPIFLNNAHIFLKYIEDALNELYNKLKEGKRGYEGADPEEVPISVVFFFVSCKWAAEPKNRKIARELPLLITQNQATHLLKPCSLQQRRLELNN